MVDESYLEYRIKSTAYFGTKLIDLGIPVVEPLGGHAIYVDAGVGLLRKSKSVVPK